MLSLSRKKTASDDTEAKPKAALPMAKIGAFAAALAINAGLIFSSYQWYIAVQQEQRLTALSQKQAQSAIERLGFQVHKLQTMLDQYGQRQALVAALSVQSTDLSPWLSSLQQLLPEGNQAALVRAYAAPESQYPEFGFRFAELDMINHAEKGDKPAPEVGGRAPNQTFSLIAPARLNQDSPIVGTVIARLPTAILRSALRGDGTPDGLVRLQQGFDGSNAKPVIEVGDGAGPVVSARYNQFWTVQFQANEALIKQSRFYPIWLYGLWFVALLLSLFLAHWASSRWLAKQQQRQQLTRKPTAEGLSAGGSKPALDAVMKVKVAKEDQQLLAGESAGRKRSQPSEPVNIQFPGHVFRAYDIRGLAGQEITRELATQLGRALGTRVLADGGDALFVGRDGRNSSPELYNALIDGILSTGANTLELELIPSPLLYYAVATSDNCKSGVIVTASHNGAAYNGFKITLNGQSLADDEIQQLRQAMEAGNFQTGHGSTRQVEVVEPYIDEILSDVALMGDVKIVIDAGNGATSDIAPLLFSEMGCEVVPLYCDFDGNFPNHDPDPSNADNLQDLIDRVIEEGADLGVAFDGDGDRIFVVTESGQVITADRLLMLFAKDIVSRNPGTDVVFDVKCTRQLGSLISSYGGRPIMWKTGHAHMKAKIQETEALLGGEFSGHIFIKDRWYGFDDGLLVAARLLEIMSLREQSLDDIFASFPVLPATPEIRIPVPEEKKFSIIQNLIETGDFQSGTATTVDGLRVDFAKGWGLVRASNTGAELTLRFEGDTEEVIAQLKLLFKRELTKVDASLPLDF
ncbi:phosphomannomutase/phosphoglucomutase [Halioxenophilus sp. WMMB6]|uniref:phosphomannomutase/phosphoglucomutase n=1 Tax=Halioxenophilus sp. WMMB6 TaxID=3073815 RepID=UPI00295E8693|nr:phosphomannomutase/phosphoglucomutase [Halioxenophilus sp. WMMB6]